MERRGEVVAMGEWICVGAAVHRRARVHGRDERRGSMFLVERNGSGFPGNILFRETIRSWTKRFYLANQTSEQLYFPNHPVQELTHSSN